MNKEQIEQRIAQLRQGAVTLRSNAKRFNKEASRAEGAADELEFMLKNEKPTEDKPEGE